MFIQIFTDSLHKELESCLCVQGLGGDLFSEPSVSVIHPLFRQFSSWCSSLPVIISEQLGLSCLSQCWEDNTTMLGHCCC